MKRPNFFRRHVSALLLVSLLASLLFHFAVVPLLLWLLGTRTAFNEPKEVVRISSSSIIRLTRRTVPVAPRPAQQPQTQPRPVQRPVQRRMQPQPPSAPAHRELARIDRRALRPLPPKARYSHESLDTAQQERQFERTIAKLREQNNPVVSAARPVQTPAAAKPYTFNFSGSIGSGASSEGILTPVKSWHQDGYDYYYVRYWVQYEDGTTETGVVPWPLRYLPAHDPFRLGLEHFPLPVPLPDYTLPPGTPLHPLVAYCYKHRADLDDCPIYHE